MCVCVCVCVVLRDKAPDFEALGKLYSNVGVYCDWTDTEQSDTTCTVCMYMYNTYMYIHFVYNYTTSILYAGV